jgi:DNA-binding NarL/FixJ family response regulator
MDPLRLLLADDHPEVLSYLSARLDREPDLRVVCQAADSEQALALTRTYCPDVVIIDPAMKDGKGFDALKQITDSFPGITIVVLTAIVDTAMRIELDRLGIKLVMSKGADTGQLVGTLTKGFTEST